MKSSRIRLIVVLGTLSMLGILLVQIYWVKNAFDSRQKHLRQTINIALMNVAEKLAEFNESQLPDINPVKEIDPDYYVVNINGVIDPGVLEHFLRTEFNARNLRTDFEYGIYDCNSDRMAFGKFVSATHDTLSYRKATHLPKLDGYTYYFGIYFPELSYYLFHSMRAWMVSSFILMAVIIFFSYSLYVILQQKRLADVQKDFLDNMTHEFKTPVSTIAIAAEVLNRPDISQDPKRLSNYASIVKGETSRLQSQVEKILQMAGYEKASIRLSLEELDLHELVKQSLDSFRLTSGSSIQTDFKATTTHVKADKVHLMNVIYNLLDNAVKYTDKKPEIVISTHNEGRYIRLGIQDNGIGIKKDFHKKIFDKFFRVPTGNIHKVKGFGLGLNYVRNIAKAHGWKISVDSEPGKGTRFLISIPQ